MSGRVSPPNGGISGVYNSATTAAANTLDSAGGLLERIKNLGTYTVVIAVAAVAGGLLLIAYSMASGKQDLAASINAGANLAKNATPAGRAAAVAGV